MPSPELFWDAAQRRYRDAGGRFVSESAIRNGLEDVTRASAIAMRDLSGQLRDGMITVAQWQTRMADEIKTMHVVSATVAHGGKAQMGPSDYGYTGSEIKKQYQYLRAFAEDIESGRQPMTDSLLARAELYAHAGRQTYEHMRARDHAATGYDQERNVLGPAEHCPDCLMATSAGWVGLGELTPPGSRQCRVRCHCTIAYRRAA